MTSLYEIAQQKAWLTPQQRAMNWHSDADLFEWLIQQPHIDEQDLLDTLSSRLRLPRVHLASVCRDQDILFPSDLCHEQAIPLYQSDDGLCVAVNNPFAPIDSHGDIPIKKTLVTREEFLAEVQPSQEMNHLLKGVLTQGYDRGASDIHIHRDEEGGLCHYRIDGHMVLAQKLSPAQMDHLIQVIKLEANLDVGSFHQAQNGRLTTVIDEQSVDARVSIVPTLSGEDVVIRLFYPHQSRQTLAACGFDDHAQALLTVMCDQVNGLVLVTGPTGSGKTTTLYAMLRYIVNCPTRHIVSLEDPIESVIDGVHQSPVQQDSGYTYDEGLKSMLRQDPDVIMIGEIRDAQTAQIALEAAYTGHLVLSTLHTGDVKGSLLRLLGLGLDPFMCRYALKGIVSQSLSPTPCTCKDGCKACQFTGVKGRQLNAEILLCEGSSEGSVEPDDWIAEGTHYRM